jgi:AraC-like DNA-binding protein
MQGVAGFARANPGMTMPELAARFGLSPSYTARMMRRAGVLLANGNDVRSQRAAARKAARKATQDRTRRAREQAWRERDERIIEAAQQPGAFLALVADQCGVTTATVWRVLGKTGIKLADGRHTPRGLMPCGTNAAATRHRNHGELLDDACLKAEREYRKQWPRSKAAA